jgi:hypothetical protein
MPSKVEVTLNGDDAAPASEQKTKADPIAASQNIHFRRPTQVALRIRSTKRFTRRF